MSGAQFLAANGIPIATVQLLGGWSSRAVEKYTQAAPLTLAPVAPAVALGNLGAPGLAGDPGGLGAMRAGPDPPDSGGRDLTQGPDSWLPMARPSWMAAQTPPEGGGGAARRADLRPGQGGAG